MSRYGGRPAMLTPHPSSQHLGLTWLEPEEVAYSGGFRRRAFVQVRPNEHNPLPDLPIGGLRVVRCGIPDTYSTIPARMTFKGKVLRGYVSVGEGRTDTGGMRGDVFTFTPEADPARCEKCLPGDGCKR